MDKKELNDMAQTINSIMAGLEHLKSLTNKDKPASMTTHDVPKEPQSAPTFICSSCGRRYKVHDTSGYGQFDVELKGFKNFSEAEGKHLYRWCSMACQEKISLSYTRTKSGCPDYYQKGTIVA